MPIGCGGVAVYPGDIIVGDRDGVVVIPARMADEVARDAAEQEELEEFLLAAGRRRGRLPGTYPPNEATKAAFEALAKASADTASHSREGTTRSRQRLTALRAALESNLWSAREWIS